MRLAGDRYQVHQIPMMSRDAGRNRDTFSGPDFSFETRWRQAGRSRIAGADEAGRGPLAGPVVAACVILPKVLSGHVAEALSGLDDSKNLTDARRTHLFEAVQAHAESVSCVSLSAHTIDATNILAASLAAMRLALLALPILPEVLLVDGNRAPDGLPNSVAVETIVKGDARSLSIAAASIIAKVTRDRMMEKLDEQCPDYGLGRHKGYGSAQHRACIADHGGVARVHRFSFSPLKSQGDLFGA